MADLSVNGLIRTVPDPVPGSTDQKVGGSNPSGCAPPGAQSKSTETVRQASGNSGKMLEHSRRRTRANAGDESRRAAEPIQAGGAVESRTTRWVASSMWRVPIRLPLISCAMERVASCPIWTID